jgi:2Fe-2S ferredoxin
LARRTDIQPVRDRLRHLQNLVVLEEIPLMGVIHVTDREGQRHTLECVEGWRVMEIIRDWGLPIEGLCGGACECATCHVFVGEDWIRRLYPATDEEENQLDTVITAPTSRLSCQIIWTPDLDGLELTLAPTGG